MNTKSTTFIPLMGLLTALTLAGSIWLLLYLTGPNSINQSRIVPTTENDLLAYIVGFASLIGGGVLWGLGIALLTKTDAKAMVKACALSWCLTAFGFMVSLGLSLGAIFKFGSTINFRYNYYYLMIILPAIGIATGINGWVVIRKLGLKELRKKASLKIGIASALGFLAVSLFLQFVLGWEVGKPVPGKYEMLTLLHYCNVGAAMVGGSVLGRELAKSKSGLESTPSAND